MKISRVFRVAGLSFAMALTLSCGEGSTLGDIVGDITGGLTNGLTSITGNNILQNSQLGFAPSANLPEGETDCIKGVKISGSAISGGSTFIIITSSEQLQEIYLQIGDEGGYYVHEVKPEDGGKDDESGDYIYTIVLEFYQQLAKEDGEGEDGEEITFKVSGKTVSGKIAEEESEKVITKEAKSGALQVSVSWDRNDDVDLYVTIPSGETVYFGRDEVGNAKLDIDSNAGCSIDGINSENIYIERPLEDGTYKVEVELFSKCGREKDEARYNVTANLGGKFINFSNKQSGQFKGSEYRERVEIGTITIRNGQVVD